MLRALLVAGALGVAAVGLFAAPSAHAAGGAELAYLQTLNQNGGFAAWLAPLYVC
jgi:hypothetical protein